MPKDVDAANFLKGSELRLASKYTRRRIGFGKGESSRTHLQGANGRWIMWILSYYATCRWNMDEAGIVPIKPNTLSLYMLIRSVHIALTVF